MVDALNNSARPSLAEKQFKIIIVGESTVGKTSLIQRYMFHSFEEHMTVPTLNNEFKTKQLSVDVGDPGADLRGSIVKENVRLHVWDTAGQERFRQITRMYYRDSHGVVICFDITTQDTFDACSFWVKDLEKNAPEKAIKFLCGLKCDLEEQR